MSALVPKMSALTPKADIHPLFENVRFGPKADTIIEPSAADVAAKVSFFSDQIGIKPICSRRPCGVVAANRLIVRAARWSIRRHYATQSKFIPSYLRMTALRLTVIAPTRPVRHKPPN
jgi:hypothetical protein